MKTDTRHGLIIAVGGITPIVWFIGTAAALFLVYLHRTTPAKALLLGSLMLVSAHLAAVDLKTRRLPNQVVGPLAVIVTVVCIVGGLVNGELQRAAGAIAAGIILSALSFVLHLAKGLGMGDVKYCYPIGVATGWFGAGAVQIALLVSLLSGAIVGLIAIGFGLSPKAQIAFGPYLGLGLFAGLVSESI